MDGSGLLKPGSRSAKKPGSKTQQETGIVPLLTLRSAFFLASFTFVTYLGFVPSATNINTRSVHFE